MLELVGFAGITDVWILDVEGDRVVHVCYAPDAMWDEDSRGAVAETALGMFEGAIHSWFQ